MRDQFEKILREHGIYGEDLEEVLYAVSDMLNLSAEKTEKEEPYATNSIQRMKAASREVMNLTTLL